MEVSEEEDSIIQEEHIMPEHIRAGFPRRNSGDNEEQYKFASVPQIRALERASQTRNQKILEHRPLLFSEDEFSSPSFTHFVSQNGKQSYSIDGKVESGLSMIQSGDMQVRLRVPLSNIKRETALILQLKNLKRKKPIELHNLQVSKQEQNIKYKYILMLSDINLSIKVLVKLSEEFKVWKQIQVPLTENKFRLQIREFNNEQTDIKINDFLFHLILKLPFSQQSCYLFLHNNTVEIEKIQLTSKSQSTTIRPHQSYCTKDCQLI